MATRDEICAVCDQYIALLSKGDVGRNRRPLRRRMPGSRTRWARRRSTATRRSASSTPGSPASALTATRLGPVTVVGHEAAFQFRIDVPIGEDTMSMVTTDLMTFDESRQGHLHEGLCGPGRQTRHLTVG